MRLFKVRHCYYEKGLKSFVVISVLFQFVFRISVFTFQEAQQSEDGSCSNEEAKGYHKSMIPLICLRIQNEK